MASIVIKSTLQGNFTIISNEFARDPDVTPRAAKVYNYLMSNTEGWETSAARIAKIINMGEGSVKAALRDLTDLGYLHRERIHGDGGKFLRMEYQLHATPTTGRKASDGPTSENGPNLQAGTSGQETSGGQTSGGEATDIRRTTSKKINHQEDQREEGAFAPVADAPAPKKKSRKKPALPLPENWTPSERTVQAMTTECPTVDQEKELLAFRDHWWSKDERRASWDATYRNWIRRSAEWSSKNQRPRSNVNSLADWGAPSTQQQQPSGQNPFRSIYDEMRAING